MVAARHRHRGRNPEVAVAGEAAPAPGHPRRDVGLDRACDPLGGDRGEPAGERNVRIDPVMEGDRVGEAPDGPAEALRPRGQHRRPGDGRPSGVGRDHQRQRPVEAGRVLPQTGRDRRVERSSRRTRGPPLARRLPHELGGVGEGGTLPPRGPALASSPGHEVRVRRRRRRGPPRLASARKGPARRTTGSPGRPSPGGTSTPSSWWPSPSRRTVGRTSGSSQPSSAGLVRTTGRARFRTTCTGFFRPFSTSTVRSAGCAATTRCQAASRSARSGPRSSSADGRTGRRRGPPARGRPGWGTGARWFQRRTCPWDPRQRTND